MCVLLHTCTYLCVCTLVHTFTEIEITGGHWSLSEHLGQMAAQVWICSDNIYYMMYIGGLANIPLTDQLSIQISILISTSACTYIIKCMHVHNYVTTPVIANHLSAFITGLLNNVGTHIDPTRLIMVCTHCHIVFQLVCLLIQLPSMLESISIHLYIYSMICFTYFSVHWHCQSFYWLTC